MNAPRFAAYSIVVTAGAFGTISLILFGAFLLLGPLSFLDLSLGKTGALILDGLLCLAFFIQHSAMIRLSFRNRLSRTIPRVYHGAVYAIASGVVLLALVLLWQESGRTIIELNGPGRWLLRSLVPAAGIIFIWGVRALGRFDTFGIHAILDRIRGKDEKQLPLAARGPYRWMRHPLYFVFLLLIWSYPTLTSDRLLFNLAWTVWVVIGTMLEERDLVAAFGDSYRDYQRKVPMLIPWRVPRDRHPGPN